MFFDNEIEAIHPRPCTGQRIHSLDNLTLYPTNLFVTTKERINFMRRDRRDQQIEMG